MATTFFLRDTDCSRGYSNFRGMHKWKELRRYANRLWALYEPLADIHFRQDARHHFLARYWEMYLTVALMANGVRPLVARTSGPEFHFVFRGEKVWIEAIAPNAGIGPDRVSEDDPADNFRVPLERILLRYTSALREKKQKLAKDIARGIVGMGDPYVVGVNSKGIPFAYAGNTLPYMLQALFPIGPLTLHFDKKTRQITSRVYERREVVVKNSGSEVRTTAFLDRAYAGISAAIHSSVDAAHLPNRLAGDFYVVHNPGARNPLPLALFAQWPQYIFAEGSLTRMPPSRRTSQRRMSVDLRSVLRAPRGPFW